MGRSPAPRVPGSSYLFLAWSGRFRLQTLLFFIFPKYEMQQFIERPFGGDPGSFGQCTDAPRTTKSMHIAAALRSETRAFVGRLPGRSPFPDGRKDHRASAQTDRPDRVFLELKGTGTEAGCRLPVAGCRSIVSHCLFMTKQENFGELLSDNCCLPCGRAKRGLDG